MPEEREGLIWVRRTYPQLEGKGEAEVYEEKSIFPQKGDLVGKVAPDDEELARVKVGMGMTLNIGNYQSARVDVGIELPCRIAEIREAYVFAWKVCEHETRMQIRSARKGADEVEGAKRGRS
jgi:hypothetical protein